MILPWLILIPFIGGLLCWQFERFGNTYAFATRLPYEARYNTDRNADLAFLITHIHPAVWVE